MEEGSKEEGTQRKGRSGKSEPEKTRREEENRTERELSRITPCLPSRTCFSVFLPSSRLSRSISLHFLLFFHHPSLLLLVEKVTTSSRSFLTAARSAIQRARAVLRFSSHCFPIFLPSSRLSPSISLHFLLFFDDPSPFSLRRRRKVTIWTKSLRTAGRTNSSCCSWAIWCNRKKCRFNHHRYGQRRKRITKTRA